MYIFCCELEKQLFRDAKADNPSRGTQRESAAQGIAGTGASRAAPAPGDGCEAGLSPLAAMLCRCPADERPQGRVRLPARAAGTRRAGLVTAGDAL